MLSKLIRADNIGQGEGVPGRMNYIHRLGANSVILDIAMASRIQMEGLMTRVRSLLD